MTTERTQDVNFDLPIQVKWWLNGEGWLHKNGHFNFNHYCKVVNAKYEDIRNNTLLSRNANGTQETNKIRCRSVFPSSR